MLQSKLIIKKNSKHLRISYCQDITRELLHIDKLQGVSSGNNEKKINYLIIDYNEKSVNV